MKKYFVAALALMIGVVGCEKELDIAKHGNLGGMDTFYKTDADAESALAAVYTTWRGGFFSWHFLKDALSDDVWAGGGSRGDNADIEQLNEYTFGTEHGSIEGTYTWLYSVIYSANLILDNIGEDSDVKLRARAEAKYFRAWSHFELVTLWGNAPAIDHVLAPSEYKQSTGSPEKTWELVEKDLTEAIESGKLPSKTSLTDAVTGIRVTKEAAQAMLGKAYVFQAKWAEARTVLDAVITSGKYDLIKDKDYGDILRMSTNNSVEAIIEMQMPWDLNSPVFDMNELMEGWRFGLMDVSGVKPAYADIATDAGYGFMNPRKELYDAFVAREGADGYRFKQTMVEYSFLRDEINMPILSGQKIYGNEGYFFWKNRILLSESIMGYPNFRAWQGNNKRVMRYAEVLLLAAEAHLSGSGGDVAKATKYVNEIRTRAKLPTLGSASLDDVKIEKRLELCNENVRFQDIVRWGEAATLLANQGKTVKSYNGTVSEDSFSNSTYGFKEKHKLLPIPGKEVMLNTNISQNPGW